MGVSVGVFGGMFDPPHLGHVALARTGVEHFALDRLLVRVVADPGTGRSRHRPRSGCSSPTLAFADISGAEVALDPCARTVDSLEALGLDDPVFLVGADEFASFPAWKDPSASWSWRGSVSRRGPGTRRERIDGVLARALAARAGRRCSRSSLTRSPPRRSAASVAAGEPIDGLVPVAVALEVKRLGLYRGL